MDFLKKHFEKVILAVALLVLIVSATLMALRVGALGTEVEAVAIRTFKAEPVQPMDLSKYSNAIASLAQPVLWTNYPGNPFGPAFAQTQEVVIVAPPPPPVAVPVQLVRVQRELFKLRFMAYSGAGENFQLNFQFRPLSFFVHAVGDYVRNRQENTGYKIISFERKTTNVVTDVGPREVDVSELTLQHEGEEPIRLVLNREAVQREPVATIRCVADMRTLQVRRGQRLDCGAKTYIVVDINQTQMVIVDAQSEEKHTIGLTPARD